MTLAYRLGGDAAAPVLVLSGGLGTSTAMWEPQLPSLAERYRIVRFDHPGHGASPPPDDAVTVESIALSVVDLLDELVIERASFCGLSLGGMVGQWLGANASERIDALVLACTGASLGDPALYAERAARVRAEGTAFTVDAARERWFTPAFRDSEEARRILDELRTMSREGYAACCEAVGAFDFHTQLSLVAVPTLVIVGADDPVTPPAVVTALVSGIPGAHVRRIDGAAHLANVEQPQAFTASMLSHLQERTPA